MTTEQHWDAVERALRRLESDWDAAGCHGRLTGLYVAQGSVDAARWLDDLAPKVRPGDLVASEARAILAGLAEQTVAALNDTNLGFTPLLPEEETALVERVQQLGEWCQGFLVGISEGGVTDYTKLPTDSAEILRDLADIARADSYELSDEEEDEAAFVELLEYVRTGVLLVNEELHPTQAAPIIPGDDITYH